MTQRLYYTNSYLAEFEASVVAVAMQNGRPAIQLDRSAFYPASGGQPNDTGWLDGQRVLDVIAEDGVVWHVVDHDAARYSPGQSVHGAIDWPRRFDHMQQHSGQHLLSQVFERLYNYETVSVHIGEEENTLDLDAATLDTAQIDAAERRANEQVYAALPISAYFVEEDDISRLRLRRPPKVKGAVRIVEIADYDYSACGGTHCHSTAELGPIKIVRTERRRGGVRVTFLCGGRALDDYLCKHRWLTSIAGQFSTDPAETPALVERNLMQVKELQRRVDELSTRLLGYESQTLLAGAPMLGSVRLVAHNSVELDASGLRTLANALIAAPGVVALLAGAAGGKLSLVFARSADIDLHMGNLLRDAMRQFGGSGGGRADFAQGGGGQTDQANDILAFAQRQIGDR